MKHLFKDWRNIRERIQQAPNLFLFLDYDGTLVPITSRPERALCPSEVKTLLGKLRESPKVMLAIVSGRSLEDIRARVGVPGITYVGNHGLDLQNSLGKQIRMRSARRQKELCKIGRDLKISLGEIPGILFEDKGSLLAVHYRNVAQENFGRIQKVLGEIEKKSQDRWKIAEGKKVFEIQPKVNFNKGKAVKKLFKNAPRGTLPIYLGDDRTDEDAFRALQGRGINIFVGSVGFPSAADYYLKSPREVGQFLRRCEQILKVPTIS